MHARRATFSPGVTADPLAVPSGECVALNRTSGRRQDAPPVGDLGATSAGMAATEAPVAGLGGLWRLTDGRHSLCLDREAKFDRPRRPRYTNLTWDSPRAVMQDADADPPAFALRL